MKRIISLTLAILMFLFLTACKDNEKSDKKTEKEEVLCSNCGEAVMGWTKMCLKCGAPVVQGEHSQDGLLDWQENNTILSFLKDTKEKPLIVYFIEDDNYAKDAEVWSIYVIQNGKCRKFLGMHTLGELSKMTDSEIIEMYEEQYQEGLKTAVTKWKSKNSYEWNSGKVKIYNPVYYDIQGVLLTDDTGNYVESEILFFPVSGVGHSPYVIEYPQYTDREDQFMNYYGTYEEDSYRDIQFAVKYFNTGYGTKSDLNQINDLYCISNSSIITGTVYDSLYYGFRTLDSQWTSDGGILFFRHQDACVMDITVDALASEDVYDIDPTEQDMLSLSMQYYYDYYGSFVPVDQVVDFPVEVEPQEPVATEVATTPAMPATVDIRIQVADEDGVPVENAVFQVIFEGAATPYITDENGVITFTGLDPDALDEMTLSLLSVPEGYQYPGESTMLLSWCTGGMNFVLEREN